MPRRVLPACLVRPGRRAGVFVEFVSLCSGKQLPGERHSACRADWCVPSVARWRVSEVRPSDRTARFCGLCRPWVTSAGPCAANHV